MHKTYEEMKDSGVEWIGMVPEHWTIAKQKYFIKLINGRAYADDEFEAEGKYRVLRVGNFFTNSSWYYSDLELEPEKYCDNGDLLYAWSASYGPKIWDGGKVIYHYHIWKCELGKRVNKIFCYYYFLALGQFVANSAHGTAMMHITMQMMNNAFMTVPPLSEQAAIAAYLDDKCGAIDAIITEAKAGIEEYKAWKASVIFEAVTKGLDPNAEMKDSGVEWIGQIPRHWDATRLQRVFRIKKDIAGKIGYTVLSVTQQGIKPKNMNSKGQFALDYSKYQLVHKGDFVMNHMDLLTGWVDISVFDGVTSPDYRVFSSVVNCQDAFFRYVFQYCYLNRVFYGLGQGVADVGRWRLPADMFRKFMLPFPPLSEQAAIAAYLDDKCSAIDGVIAEKEALIAELETYKKSLIFETVTGKRRVC